MISLFLIISQMPNISSQTKGKLDIVGSFLLISAIVPLMLVFTWGGKDWAWASATTIFMISLSVVALIAYVVAERFASDPILPLNLFRDRLFWTANLSGFLITMGFIGTIALLPVFIQVAQGASAMKGGLLMLPLLLSIMFSAIISGLIAAKTGRIKPIILCGVVVTGFAIWLLSRMTPATSGIDLVLRTLLFGIGLGPCQSLFMIALQNGAKPDQMGLVTSVNQFSRQIGATIGISLFGGILISELRTASGSVISNSDFNKLIVSSVTEPATQAIVATTTTHIFGLGVVVLGAAVVTVLLMPQIILRERIYAEGSMEKSPSRS